MKKNKYKKKTFTSDESLMATNKIKHHAKITQRNHTSYDLCTHSLTSVCKLSELSLNVTAMRVAPRRNAKANAYSMRKHLFAQKIYKIVILFGALPFEFRIGRCSPVALNYIIALSLSHSCVSVI